jgi:glutamate racemase
MSDSRPIGVFDSGIGGLTVVKALRDLLPNEKVFYLGDTARVPYGGKSASTVERYSIEMADMLVDEGVKTIVIACNSASAVALPKLEKTRPFQSLAIAGSASSCAATRNRHIGITNAHTDAARMESTRTRSQDRHLRARLPLLVPSSKGWLEDDLTDQIIARYLEPLVREGVDTLVLGCTHYPLLIDALSRALGEKVKLVDSARNCATAVQELLDQEQLRTPSGTSGGLEVTLTDLPDSFLQVARDALQLDIGEVHLRDVLHPAPH